MLSDASIEKIGWVKNMWQRWIKSKTETNDTILQCDIVSLFRNFRGAASDYLCDFFEEICFNLTSCKTSCFFSSPFRHAIKVQVCRNSA